MIGHYSQLAHQGITDPSRSMCNGGGSGGGSQNPDTRYANLDQLYGTQNQASQFMLNNAMPYVPQLTQNSMGMVNDAMNGTLANQMRQQAGNNAQASFGSALDANNRNMQRFGMGMNSNRIMSENNRNAIMGAGMKAGEMNRAGNAAEDMKWNRNASGFGQVMGMNNGAMQGMSSAGAGMANTAGQINANDQRNAAGYGQAGAAFSNALFKADGGMIHAPKLAQGGDAWAAYKAANPVQPMGSSGRSKRTNPYMAMLSGAAPQALGAGLKDVLKGDKSKIVKTGKDLLGKYQGATAVTDSPVSDTASGGIQYADGATAMYGGDMVADGASVASLYDAGNTVSSAADAASAASMAGDAATGADYVNAVSSTASAADTASAGMDFASLWAADGGYIKGKKKSGLCMAMGGLANTSVASSNKVDNTTGVAQMDASNAMLVNKMDEVAQNKAETHAKPVIDTQYSGKTTGNFETSDGDPDGFGSKSADKRHIVGKSVMSYYIPGGGLLAEVVHPIAETATRNAISLGDKMGRATLGGSDAAGFAGAFGLDPIGTIMSGKYFAEGGRVDHTAGGEVDGPGTETSDDIPAWLSDGEYVLNAEAVKLVGKKKLDKINKAGLTKRGDKPGLEMAADGGIKAAMGGNIGIAMGAGVDQWNRQQMIDQRDKEMELRQAQDARQNEQFAWQRQQHEAALAKQARLDAAQAGSLESVGNATAMAGLPAQLKARVALRPDQEGYLTQEEANGALRAYGTAGYTPEALSKKAGLQLAQADLGKGLELQKILGSQLKAEKMDRVGRHLASGDYAGLADVMSNNEFNPDGKGYKFLGTNKKDGNEYVRFGVAGADGKMVEQSVDKRVLPGLVEASLDPTKGIEYTREVGKITDKDRDNARADRQLGISGGHLGLSQAKFNLEKSTLELEAKAKKEVTDLRRKLSDTDDDAERAKINRRIADLSGAASGGGQIKVLKGEAGDADVAVYTDKQGNSYRIDPKALPLKDQPGGTPKASQYETGKIYTDAKGNKAKWNGKAFEDVK